MSYNKLKQMRINDTMRLVKSHSRHINCIRLHNSTDEKHMRKICDICIWLRQNDKDFLTEAEFIQGGRADIICLEDSVAIEVLNTEDVEKFKNKSYPIDTISVKVDEVFNGI